MENGIRAALASCGRLGVDPATVGIAEDLYELGLTSYAAVNVMLALEDEFNVEFPDAEMKKSTFASIANIAAVVTTLTESAA